ncbi:MAG: putative baseplate assembly protein [Prochloraceae cyanobacterium]|nr:putative baseplate assembly protein [Prochloraceae cyanobacterium]
MNDRDRTPKTPTNRPGLSQIAYRISDYNAFFHRLLELLPQPDASGKVPLARLTTRSTDDAAIALIDAWAIVADVLTFYQERIANEGYLRTATERRSLLELARAIGYELNPGVAASTYLTFTVEEAPDSPTVANIPKGTQVMSVPEGEELPQNFETIEDFTAYVQWNAIKPRLTRPQKITLQTIQFYLSGIDTQLEAGDSLLLLDEENPDRIYLLNLTSVETNSEENYTLVKLKAPPLAAPLDTPLLDTPLRQPQLFAFREQASLFGSNAPEWDTLSPEIKRSEIEIYGGEIEGGVIRIVSQNNNNNWQSNLVGKELPNLDISALVINQSGDLFVAIPSQGVFRLIAGSDRWVSINDGLTNFNIQSLYVNDKGHLFAGGSNNGTAGGGAFRSKDNGNSWTEIATGTIGVERDTENENTAPENPKFIAVNTSISNTVVRSFLTYEKNRTVYIFVGTDNGVYRSEDGGKNWKQVNTISGNNGSLENTVVRSLVLYKKQPPQGTGTIKSDGTKVIGEGTSFQTELTKGDLISAGGQIRLVAAINSEKEELTVNPAFDPPLSKNPYPFSIYHPPQGTGTIKSNGTTVTGQGTRFRSELTKGDLISAAGQIKLVTKITNETELTVNCAFDPPLSENSFSIYHPPQGTGTIKSNGTAVNGQGTNFLTELTLGDFISAAGQIGVVTKITNETQLTVNPVFTPPLSENSYPFSIYHPPQGTGTINSNGTTVTGEGTSFRTELTRGDFISAAGQIRVVTEITNETQLTVNRVFDRVLSGNHFSIYHPPQGTRTIAQGTGTIKSNGTTVIGEGTSFLTEITLGDLISAADQIRVVTAITDDTQLTVNRAFDLPLSDNSFSIYHPPQGTGTIKSNGTAVTGQETNFLTELTVGDFISAAGQIKLVTAINSQTELTVNCAFDPPLSENPYPFSIYHPPQGTGTISSNENETTVNGMGTSFLTEITLGDLISAAGQIKLVTAINSQTELTVNCAFDPPLSENSFSIYHPPQGTGTISLNENQTTVTGEGTSFITELRVGDLISAAGQIRVVAAITSERQLALDRAFDLPLLDNLYPFSIYNLPQGTGTISLNANETTVTGEGTSFITELREGDVISAAGQIRLVAAINSERQLTLDRAFNPPLSENPYAFSIYNLSQGTGTISPKLIAGTDTGVFELTNITANITPNSPTWTDKSGNIPLEDRDIQILISYQPNQDNPEELVLYAGTANGRVYKFPDHNEQWESLGTIDSDSPQKITSLAVNSDERILAGTESQGLYYFINNQTWKPIDPTSKTIKIPQAITSLAVKEKEFFAGTKFAGFPQEEWPNFEIADRPIQLDTLYPQILNNSLIVLVNGEHFEYRRVQSISTPLVSGFELSAQITQIEPNDRLREPNKFNRRTTNVLVQSEPLELAPEILTIPARGEEIFQDPIQQETFLEPIQQDFNQTKTIFLSQFIENLQSDRKIIISGKRIRTQINDIGGILRPAKWQQIRSLTERAVYSLVANIFNIFAGTDRGIYRSSNNGENWELLGLPEVAVFSLKIHNNDIFAGSDRGIYHSTNNGDNWKNKSNESLAQAKVFSLAIHSLENVTYIFAGSDRGIYRSIDNGNKWEPARLPEAAVFSLAIQTSFRSGTGTIKSDDTTVTGVETSFTKELIEGALIRVEDQIKVVTEIINETQLRVDNPFDSPLPGNSFSIYYLRQGTGTISSNGIAVTGMGTSFTKELTVGALIRVEDQIKVVIEIINETQLRVDTAFESSLSDNSFSIGITYIFAGSDRGLYRSSDNGENWEKTSNESLAQAKVFSLAIQTTFRSGKGTISLNENETRVTGMGTSFTTELTQGALIGAAGQIRVVTEITNETQLKVDTAFNPPLSENPYPFSIGITYIFAGSDRGIYRSSNNGEKWKLFGLSEVAVLSLETNNNYIFAGTDSGSVLRSRNNGENWIPIDAGLRGMEVRSLLAIDANNNLFAATEVGIFRSPDNGANIDPIKWEPSNSGLTNSQVQSLVMNSEETVLLAGTTQGIFRSLDNSNSWEAIDSWESIEKKLENKNIQALLLTSKLIFVGTAEGLFRSKDNGVTWQQIKEDTGLIYSNILTLAVNDIDNDNTETLLVGTIDGGLFQSTDNGKIWKSVGLYNTDVQTIAIQKQLSNNYHLFVGTTEKGIYRSIDRGNSWEQIIETRPGRGRISSKDNQVTWEGSNFNQQIKPGDTINAAGQTRTVTAVPDVPDNTTEVTLSVDTPFRSDLVAETLFTINTGLTNRSITAVAAGSRRIEETITINNNNTTITITEDKKKFTDILKVGDTISIDLNENIQTRTVTQISEKSLTVDEPFVLDQQIEDREYIIIINKDLIFAGSSGSGVFRSKDNGDRWEQINVNLTDLEIRCLSVDLIGNVWVGTSTDGVFRSNNNGDFWISFNDNLANIDVRAIVVSQANSENNKIFVGGIGILISPDGFESSALQRQDVLEVLKAPTPIQQEPLYQKWRVKDKDGFEADLKTALPSQEFTLNHLTLLPAAEDSEVVSEVVTIAIPPNDEQLPLLTLREPLKNSYDPETVDIYANLVQATHGQTVEEVLGSGDGNASNQRFTLQEPPLTYVSAPTASGAKSTLEVRVNGVLWQEVPSLYPLKPHDQSYIIRIEDDGTTSVTFGDGVKGSRLPTGLENITATYRQGIGTEGNVGAKSLSVLNSTPPAIAEVINSLPATGGTPAESIKQVREKAPSTGRILDRIVSLQDFEDFARSFTGIGKAIATELWSEQTQIVHITIASDAGESVPQESRLYTSLIEAIDAARDPLQQVVVDSYQPLRFNIEAKLLVNPRYQSEVVALKARDALKKTFDFQVRNFGQPVTTAEAIAAIQNVEGVTAVDLDALYQSVRSKALNQSLFASLARYYSINNQILPAQMLLLNSAGIKLTIVPTL